MEFQLLFVIFCTIAGGILGSIFGVWYMWALYGFLIGIGIPLIGMFGIID